MERSERGRRDGPDRRVRGAPEIERPACARTQDAPSGPDSVRDRVAACTRSTVGRTMRQSARWPTFELSPPRATRSWWRSPRATGSRSSRGRRAPLMAFGVWWMSNTVAHNFIHRPFFRSGACEPRVRALPEHGARHSAGAMAGASSCASCRARTARPVDAGPRDAGRGGAGGLGRADGLGAGVVRANLPPRLRWRASCCARCTATTSTSRERPATTGGCTTCCSSTTGITSSTTRDPASTGRGCRATATPPRARSRWPAPLRWLDAFGLEGLERLVLRSAALQRFVVATHTPGASRR